MFAAAAVFSMLGLGGGVLYTPIQLLFGIDFHVAAANSLFLIMTVSLSATLVFRKADRIDWPLAWALESITALGGLAGGLYSRMFSGAFLSYVFAAVVGLAAVFMIREFKREPAGLPEKTGWFYWRRRFGGRDYRVNMASALPVSFVAGAVSGLVGVGGGVLQIPLMVLALGVPMDIAVGSSAFMIGLTALAGFSGHLVSGHWDWKTSVILAVAVFLGGRIGARKSVTLNKEKMKKTFGWFLVGIAALMAAQASLH